MPISVDRAHAELREHGIVARWQDIEDRRLSSPEDLERIDSLSAAIKKIALSPPAKALYRPHDAYEVDELMAHYAALDHQAIASITTELHEWHAADPEPLRRHQDTDKGQFSAVFEQSSMRRGWAVLAEARARLPLGDEYRAEAIKSIAHLLAVPEQPTFLVMLTDIATTSRALQAMAEHQDLWDEYGEEFLTLIQPWCQPSYWQAIQAKATLYQLRQLSALIDAPDSYDLIGQRSQLNRMQIRLSATQALLDMGKSFRLARDHEDDPRSFIQAAKAFDEAVLDQQGWWQRQRTSLSQKWVRPQHDLVQRWMRLCLTFEVLRHEMGHGPWPEDPWDEPGMGLRRYPEQGPLERVWSVGPNGIDQGGDQNDGWANDDIILSWPKP